MDQPSSTDSNAITLRIRFKSASLDEFIGRYGADVSPGGIFIRTKQPVEVGTSLQFDFLLGDGSPLLSGLGTVAWVRESDPARANNVPGMGLRFDKLTAESQHTHQLILAEKARMEGKATSTPYPPTAFVAPPARVSPPPEAAKPAEPPKQDAGPSNFATTRPAPASLVRPPTPAPATRSAEPVPGSRPGTLPPATRPATTPPASRPVTLAPLSAVEKPHPVFNFGDSDEFSEAGKTEVSEKPLDYYLKEAEAAEAAKVAEESRRSTKTTEEAVPRSLLDEAPTGATEMPITKSGPPPEGFDVGDSAPSVDSQAFASSETDGAPVDLGESGQIAVPSGEVMPELSAGVPIEETAPEKTEEVSSSSPAPAAPLSAAPLLGAPEPIDLGTGLESFADDRPPSRDHVPSLKPKGSGKTVAVIAVVAAAAAFAAVYLVKAKPWQDKVETVAAVAPPVENPVPAPAPVPSPAAEPAKPAADPVKAAEEPAVAKKPVEEPKAAAVAEKVEGKQEAAQEPAKEPAKDKKEAAEKPVAEKAEKPEKASKGEGEGKSGKAASKAAKWDDKPVAAEDEIYRLVVRSAPISAEVLIDGEYFSRTPCERRILDPSKPYAVVIRKEGYQPHERTVNPSDNWVKKGEERVLTITASLKKSKAAASPASSTFEPAEEVQPKKAEPTAKPEAPAAAETTKPAAKEVKSEPAAPKAEPAKPAAPAADKPSLKTAPSFDDPGKAKE